MRSKRLTPATLNADRVPAPIYTVHWFHESEHPRGEMRNEKFEAYKQLINDSDEAMVAAEKARLGGDIGAAEVLSAKAILMRETASQMFNPVAENPKG